MKVIVTKCRENKLAHKKKNDTEHKLEYCVFIQNTIAWINDLQ